MVLKSLAKSKSATKQAKRVHFVKPKVILIADEDWAIIGKRYNMTRRELQIAQHVCYGQTNDEIAAVLRVRAGTVKTHIRNIYRKAWVHSKISMLLRFIEDITSQSKKIAKKSIVRRGH